ncbi:MAG: hypothetical protein WDZ72_05845 [Cyclobacteriaceae bacterium]
MEILIGLFIVGFILILILIPLVYYTRQSSDIRLEGELLIIRYPFRKVEIHLNNDLKSWSLQEARFLWIGKVFAINLELNSGKWHHVNSRFNPESFENLLELLEGLYEERKRKSDG